MSLLWLLRYWLDFDINKFNRMQERQFDTYFDLDLITCGANEVFVDVGAFDGDTVLRYISNFGPEAYKKIYCYEINQKNCELIKDNLKDVRDVDIRRKGAGKMSGEMQVFDAQQSEGTRLIGGHAKQPGTSRVPVVALDDDIDEPITFLKMDIEGAEYDALLGAERHIREDRPKMAISVYHSNDDLWRLYELIAGMASDYSYHFRFNARSPEELNPFVFAADYILFALPQ